MVFNVGSTKKNPFTIKDQILWC